MNTKFVKYLALSILTIIISYFYFARLNLHPLQDDEHATTRRSPIIFQEYFRIPLTLKYDEFFWPSYVAYDHPSMVYLIYGFVDTLVYRSNWQNLLVQTNFIAGYPLTDPDHYIKGDWWVDCVGIQDPLSCIPNSYKDAFNLILLNRYISVIMGILSLVLVYEIGYICGGFFLATASEILLASSKVYWYYSRTAILDIPFLFFELLLIYICIRSFARKDDGNMPSIWVAVVLGVLCGFAADTKINGFMFLPVIVTVYILYWFHIKKKIKYLSHTIVSSVVVCLFSFITYFILNPFLWVSPYTNFMFAYNWKQIDTDTLLAIFPQFAYPSIQQRPLMIVQNLFFSDGCCTMFKEFNNFWIIGFILFLYGSFLIIKNGTFYKTIPLVFFLGTFISMVFYLKLDFDRYFLPIIPFQIYIQAFGLYELYALIFRKHTNYLVKN